MRYALKLAWRSMRRDRAGLIFILLTLGFAIGLTTAVFGVLDALVLRPVLVPHADRLVHIGGLTMLPNGGEMDVWRAQQSLEALAYYRYGSMNLFDPVKGQRVHVAAVSSSFFDVFDVPVLLGRRFTSQDQQETADLAVVSYGFWQAWFGGDRELPGRTVLLNGRPYTLIGVLAEPFEFPAETQIWVLARDPYRDSNRLFKSGGDSFGTTAPRWVGKRKADVTLEQVRAEYNVILERLKQGLFAKHNINRGTVVLVTPLQANLSQQIRPAITVLFLGALVVLGAGIFNTSGILLTRAIRRRQETAIQIAVGASRRDLVMKALVEAALYGLLSCAAGLLALAFAASFISEVFAGQGVVLRPSRILNLSTAGFALLASVISGVIAAGTPALHVLGVKVLAALGDHGGGMGGTRGVFTRRFLVVMEVAMACTLLVLAQMAIRSFLRLLNVETGFDPGNTVIGELALSGDSKDIPSTLYKQRAVLDSIASMPGVVAAGVVDKLPLAGGASYLWVEHPESGPLMAQRYVVGGEYFRAMGIEITEGRNFLPFERQAVIVNSELARRMWNGRALGQQLLLSGEPNSRTVVGVVRPVKGGQLEEQWEPQFYLPYSAPYRDLLTSTEMTVVARFDRLRAGLARELNERTVAASGDPLDLIRTVQDVIDSTQTPPRVRAAVLGLYAAFAVLLSAVAIYVMVSYTAAARTYELGVRMTLGAGPEEIAGLLLRECLWTVGAGVVLGSIGAVVLSGTMERLIFGIRTLDPASFATSAVILGLAGLAAGLWPAVRTSRMSPLAALRMK